MGCADCRVPKGQLDWACRQDPRQRAPGAGAWEPPSRKRAGGAALRRPTRAAGAQRDRKDNTAGTRVPPLTCRALWLSPTRPCCSSTMSRKSDLEKWSKA